MPFAVPLPASDSATDLAFEVVSAPDALCDLDSHEPVYAEGARADGSPDFSFLALPDRDVVRITDAMDFHCFPDRIICHLMQPQHRYLVEIALFGMIMALWLERRGLVTLHASTVVVGGGAVAFMSQRGGGKTSTAAACVTAGHPLLSDDLLALDERTGQVLACPGYPQMRMWPEQARHFAASDSAHPTFHPEHDKRRITVGAGFGTFHPSPAPLARLYLPQRADRADAAVTTARLAPRDAAMALVSQSFLPREMVRYRLQAARLAFFARLLAQVPVHQLTVPQGLDQLPRVVAAIEADLGA